MANFLIIYSPKKGTLEIFTLQQGVKIATFSASKCSRLLYITHGLMGFSAMTKSRYVCQFTCIFLDNDGQIREIYVPFHYALAEKNSVKARDIHLYKKLRQLIKTGGLSCDDLSKEIYAICTELKTAELKSQTFDMLVNCRDVSPEGLLKCSQHFLTNSDEADGEASFQAVCRNVQSLIQLYLFALSSESSKEAENDSLDETLNLDPRDLKGLQKLLDLATSSSENDLKTPRVRFFNETSYSMSDFLSCFDVTMNSGGCISLKSNLEDHQKFKVSEVRVQLKQVTSGFL